MIGGYNKIFVRTGLKRGFSDRAGHANRMDKLEGKGSAFAQHVEAERSSSMKKCTADRSAQINGRSNATERKCACRHDRPAPKGMRPLPEIVAVPIRQFDGLFRRLIRGGSDRRMQETI